MNKKMTFEDFFTRENVGADLGLLPIFHTTDENGLFGIIKEQRLEPNTCPVTKEDLVFFFYGKSNYRNRDAGDKYDELNLPVTFMFNLRMDGKKTISFKRFFPFDSGG